MGEEAAGVFPHPGRMAHLSEKLALPGADLQHTGHSEVGSSLCGRKLGYDRGGD